MRRYKKYYIICDVNVNLKNDIIFIIEISIHFFMINRYNIKKVIIYRILIILITIVIKVFVDVNSCGT